ncbi:type IV leader peptidase [Desulfitobacterium dichloroeliminans LMG P-21439]|uniref:Type IV leader peptidase n=1 Tax=Desulfitobacterium dichloroeliminans (strain LMG P-21439 / DCA1) TaxID=871963 RepID=L0F731_DESDL|nr:A24 family peptidase [Desulfitobacterium dichloroeliminans]AGA68835.1 type IV leader peptidase [Desulfitobacterium dichloroeliminans LMG P-21439]UWG96027.1 A24 family peptidase [Dehalobacter sp. DCM]
MVSNLPLLLQGGLFTALLVAASVSDIRKQLIPDCVCIGIALTGLLTLTPEKLLGLVTAVLLFGIALRLGGLDGGDIKYTAAVGLVLGLHKSMAGIILGFTAMLIFHAIYTLIQKARGGDIRKSYPLAPFFSLGCLTAYFFF